jgi:hypothetical protein
MIQTSAQGDISPKTTVQISQNVRDAVRGIEPYNARVWAVSDALMAIALEQITGKRLGLCFHGEKMRQQIEAEFSAPRGSGCFGGDGPNTPGAA